MSTFTLSTLDRGAPRAYIRYALTFACEVNQSTAAVERLQKATKRLVSEIPMLAGVVATNDQENPTITVTFQQVNDFEATVAYHQNEHPNYETIRGQGIAPRHVSDSSFTSLASDLTQDTNPCCAIQANLIDGGLILVIYLHHAVADIRGVATIIRLMSEGLPARELSEESLESEAMTVSQARARLSSGSGAPAFLASARDVEQRQQLITQDDGIQSNRDSPVKDSSDPRPSTFSNRAAIFRFKLNIIRQTSEMINTRRSLRDPNTTDKITPREVLIVILWRAYVRARWPHGAPDNSRTSISIPVDMRRHLVPPLEPHWMGNAEATAIASEQTLLLGLPYDLSSIERTAAIIHASVNSASSDLLTRSRIEMINQSTGPLEPSQTQLIVHDWTPVPNMLEQEMDVGLGLGRPDAIRRIGQGFDMNEVVLLPENSQTQAWDVQVELRGDWMSAMASDGPLRGFLWSVAQ